MKILIVDNDSVRQRNLRNVLSSLGHRAGEMTTVNDAPEALAILKKGGAHCVFCNISLPKGSGIDLLISVREIGRLKSLPFILYSQTVSKEEVVAASQAGASCFVGYPFTAGDVESALLMATSKAAK